jgi:replication-associated recombination protein RarA
MSQSHLVGPNGSLTQQIAKGIIPSLILGTSGTGKKQHYHKLSLRNLNVRLYFKRY